MTEIALGKPCPCLSSVIVSCCLASFPCNPGTEIFVQSLLFLTSCQRSQQRASRRQAPAFGHPYCRIPSLPQSPTSFISLSILSFPAKQWPFLTPQALGQGDGGWSHTLLTPTLLCLRVIYYQQRGMRTARQGAGHISSPSQLGAG